MSGNHWRTVYRGYLGDAEDGTDPDDVTLAWARWLDYNNAIGGVRKNKRVPLKEKQKGLLSLIERLTFNRKNNSKAISATVIQHLTYQINRSFALFNDLFEMEKRQNLHRLFKSSRHDRLYIFMHLRLYFVELLVDTLRRILGTGSRDGGSSSGSGTTSTFGRGTTSGSGPGAPPVVDNIVNNAGIDVVGPRGRVLRDRVEDRESIALVVRTFVNLLEELPKIRQPGFSSPLVVRWILASVLEAFGELADRGDLDLDEEGGVNPNHRAIVSDVLVKFGAEIEGQLSSGTQLSGEVRNLRQWAASLRQYLLGETTKWDWESPQGNWKRDLASMLMSM